jgi:hypothetical protein
LIAGKERGESPVELFSEGIFKQIAESIWLSRAGDRLYFLKVISSHMDESFDPKHQQQARGFFCAGGVLGKGVPFFELDRRWQKTLDKYGLAYYKASHCQNGWGEFKNFLSHPPAITPTERQTLDEISYEFIRLIINPVAFDSKHYLTCYGVGVKQDDFYEVIKDAHAKAVLGSDPYKLAYHMSFIECAWLMKQMGDGWGASFVCDEHEQYSPLAPEAYRELKQRNPAACEYMLSFTSVDEKNAIQYKRRTRLFTRLGTL